jgi:hypothetical protein
VLIISDPRKGFAKKVNDPHYDPRLAGISQGIYQEKWVKKLRRRKEGRKRKAKKKEA